MVSVKGTQLVVGFRLYNNDSRTVAEDFFVWSVGPMRSVNPHFNCAL